MIQNCLPEKLLVFNVKEGWAPLCKFMEIEPRSGLLPHCNKNISEKDTLHFIDGLMAEFMVICRREVINMN